MGQPFQDVGAEAAVLGGIFRHGSEAFFDVADLVQPSTFTIDSNAVIYHCLQYVFEKNPETRPDDSIVLSAAASLRLDSHFATKTGQRHLRSLTDMAVELCNVRGMAAKIRKLQLGRDLNNLVKDSQEKLQEITGDESPTDILGIIENPLFDFADRLGQVSPSKVVPMGHNALEWVRHQMEHPTEMVGISTGFRNYDQMIGGGLREECVDLIAARQKTGKTFYVDNMAINLATGCGGEYEPVWVLNVDTEMSQKEHLGRVLANLAGLNIRLIEQGKYAGTSEARQQLEDAAVRLGTLPYDYLCVKGVEFQDILAEIRRWLARRVGLVDGRVRTPCVIIWDWIKLTSPGQLSNYLKEYQALAFMCSSLKNFVGRYGARCVCFAQLNRDGLDHEDTRILRGSDAILDYVTSFSIFKKKNDNELTKEWGQEIKYTHKLIVPLSRFGPGLATPEYINIAAQYEIGRLIEGPASFGTGQERKGPQGKEFPIGDTNEQKVSFGDASEKE